MTRPGTTKVAQGSAAARAGVFRDRAVTAFGIVRGFGIGLLALVVSGCATDLLSVPPAQPNKVALPTGAPRASLLAQSQREHQRLVAAFGGEYRWPPAKALMTDILERLRLVSDRPNERYRVTILNSSLVNAFALPSGNVYVTRGLLGLANDTAEIASVLAHEIAHVTARHAVERAELESRGVLVSRVNAEVLNNLAASQSARDQARVAIAGFSRQQEIEADKLGVRTIAMAGFDAFGAHRFLLSLDRTNSMRAMLLGQKPSREGLDFLSTHPSTPERIDASLSVARQFSSPGVGEHDRAKYLRAITGMIFGEDQREGLVRGRLFVHPKLGFAFEAPEGFALENTPQAVLGIAPGGGEALRLDSARLAPGMTPEAFLRANPIEGLSYEGIEPVTLNGLAAATGTARGQEWSFRVYVVEMEGAIYRLIFAARQLSEGSDAQFRAAAASFRKLSGEESERARPARIALVTAKAGDSVASLAAPMGFLDQPQARFTVLNGIAPDEAIVPGQTYKVILE